MKKETLRLDLFGEDAQATVVCETGTEAEAAEPAAQDADARLRENADRFAALAPVLEKLEKRYAITPGDTAGLCEALEREEQSRQAETAGREQRQAQATAQARAIQQQWEQQAEAAKQIFPGLDLAAELRDPRFQALLCADVDVTTAYQVVHLNEILPAAMSYTAKVVEGKLAGAFSTAGGRPGENGGGGQSAAAPRLDAARMGKAEFRALCRRVEGGERVSLG